MFSVNKITVKLFRWTFLVIASLMTVNNALFIHTHQLQDGKVTVHAHPFKKATNSQPVKKHTHTNAELIVYQFINLVLFAILGYSIIAVARKLYFCQYIAGQYKFVPLYVNRGRAPPLF